MQLTAAAVTPPAEHAARQPAGAADAAAADACVILIGLIIMYKLPSSSFVSLQDPKVHLPAMANDLELLHRNKGFVSCAILIFCFIDALAAGKGKATSGKFAKYVETALPDLISALAPLSPKKHAAKLLYDSYRNKLAHLFRPEAGFLLCENHEIGGDYAAEVQINGSSPRIGINIDRLAIDFIAWLRKEAEKTV